MISADTNVLLRLFVDDDAVQRKAAADLLMRAGKDGLHVNAVVLAEFAWALKSNFKAPRAVAVQIIFDLMLLEELDIAHRAAAMQALHWFKSSKVGFADCLIAALNQEAGASPTFTFDQQAAALNCFALIGEEKEVR